MLENPSMVWQLVNIGCVRNSSFFSYHLSVGDCSVMLDFVT